MPPSVSLLVRPTIEKTGAVDWPRRQAAIEAIREHATVRKENPMKAMVRHKYGSPDVLHLEELRKPTARDDELLIRVHAVSLNLGDWEVRSLPVTRSSSPYSPRFSLEVRATTRFH